MEKERDGREGWQRQNMVKSGEREQRINREKKEEVYN